MDLLNNETFGIVALVAVTIILFYSSIRLGQLTKSSKLAKGTRSLFIKTSGLFYPNEDNKTKSDQAGYQCNNRTKTKMFHNASYSNNGSKTYTDKEPFLVPNKKNDKDT